MNIRFQLIDISHRTSREESYIQLFGKLHDRKIMVIDREYEAYFYAVPADPMAIGRLRSMISSMRMERGQDIFRVARAESIRRKIMGTSLELIKVVVNLPEAVAPLNAIIRDLDNVRATYMADVSHEQKYLLDRGIVPFSTCEATGEYINMKARVSVFEASGVVQTDQEDIDLDVMGFQVVADKRIRSIRLADKVIEGEEAGMIHAFKQELEKRKPDVLAGCYSDASDLPVLWRRSKLADERMDIGLDYSGIRILGRTKTSCRIAGIIHIDISRVRDRAMPKLDDVQQIEKTAKKRCAKMIALSRLTYSPGFETSRMSSRQLVDQLLMARLHRRGEVILSRPGMNEATLRAREHHTSLVQLIPLPGVRKSIVEFSFTSLYPEIIRKRNISPDTKDCSCCMRGFCRQRRGHIPSMLDDLEGSDAQALIDAVPSYLEYSRARWYGKGCAETVRRIARDVLPGIVHKAIAAGLQPILCDGERLLLMLGENSQEDARRWAEGEEILGNAKLRYESYIRKAIFLSSKAGTRYVRMDGNGRLQKHGFEQMSRNWCDLTEDVQDKVLGLAYEDRIDDAKAYLLDIIRSLKERSISKERLIISTQLQKSMDEYETVPPHVAAARIMQARGMGAMPGMDIRYYIATGKGLVREKVRLPDDQADYDADYYIRTQIIPAVRDVFSLFGIDTEKMRTGREQSTLQSFLR